MTTVTYPPRKGGHMSTGEQKAGPKVRTPVSEGYQQVNGGKNGYPASNKGKSAEYFSDRCKQSPSFPRPPATAGAGGAPSSVSNNKDYGGGSKRKKFAAEQAGPPVRGKSVKAL